MIKTFLIIFRHDSMKEILSKIQQPRPRPLQSLNFSRVAFDENFNVTTFFNSEFYELFRNHVNLQF